ncbi:MAG: grpE 1 [Myxococcales bacterium]|nr:grpE 1 [Myxococcales bacterium]
MMFEQRDPTWSQDDPTAEAEVDPAESSQKPDRSSMLRALRELEAAKGRVHRDAQRASDEMREKLVIQLLPVLDNLDRTIRAATEQGDAPAVVEGVQLVRAQLENVLRGYGAERIDAHGRLFDPAIHEAVSMIPVNDPRSHGAVIDQTEPGYRFGDRLLRPAKVVVGRMVPAPAVTHPPPWH